MTLSALLKLRLRKASPFRSRQHLLFFTTNMPSFGAKLGNPKADAARARKAAIADTKQREATKRQEDAAW
jgi:hypothetical protein